MKLALPIWNKRISPLFDTACRVLIWNIEEGSNGEWEEHDLRDLIPPTKVRRIKELGADVLICGAISNPVAYLVESLGIELLPWVRGPIDEVIEAFRSGRLDSPRYFMPGCGRMRGRNARSGGQRGQSGPGRGRAGRRRRQISSREGQVGRGRGLAGTKRGRDEGRGGQRRGFGPGDENGSSGVER